jgi:hypothetical protein
MWMWRRERGFMAPSEGYFLGLVFEFFEFFVGIV